MTLILGFEPRLCTRSDSLFICLVPRRFCGPWTTGKDIKRASMIPWASQASRVQNEAPGYKKSILRPNEMYDTETSLSPCLYDLLHDLSF